MSNEIISILSPDLGEELARDIIAHRKGIKCPLTARGAKSLLKQYQLTGNAIAAAEEHLNRGWRGFNAEWMTKPQRFNDHHNPTPKTSANYGNAEPVTPPEPKNEAAKERVRQLIQAAKRGVSVNG